jgi:dimethylargininase
MLHAITRAVSPAINQCELTHIARSPIDYERAVEQHHQYEAALKSLGIVVHSLPAEPDLPDSVFVEDTALVLDECAIITRPGADSRKPEIDSIVAALKPYRQLHFIQTPGTVDGGDILRVGKTIYVGLTTRSNQSAIDQMQEYLQPYGYAVKGVVVTGVLHLKSAVTQVKVDTLLVNPAWVNKDDFAGIKFIEVDPSEPQGTNAVMIGDAIIYSSSYPLTQKRLEAAGIRVVNVDADEVAKAEGAVTCCSLIFEVKA